MMMTHRILGIDFYAGTIDTAVRKMCTEGGLLVAPAAPGLVTLQRARVYRQALLEADLVLPDSGLMVLTSRLLWHCKFRRTSGLGYLRALLRLPQLRVPGETFWVMANRRSIQRNLAWLNKRKIQVPDECVYLAPHYCGEVIDPKLLKLLEIHQVKHVFLTIGGGVQEPLGLYLKRSLSYKPAIHCIGAALAMLSGDQIRIPPCVDRLCLGWLLRCVSNPLEFIPRYWAAFRLLPLLIHYADQPPPLAESVRMQPDGTVEQTPDEMRLPY